MRLFEMIIYAMIVVVGFIITMIQQMIHGKGA